jgi:hypothetical protein
VIRHQWGLDWSASLSQSLIEEVDKQFPADAHRWPLRQGRAATIYSWNGDYRLVVLRDSPLLTTMTVAGSPAPRDCPVDNPANPDLRNIAVLQQQINDVLDLRPQDAGFLVPTIDDTTTLQDELHHWTSEQEALWGFQLSLVLTRQWYHIRGFDMSGGFFIPPGYAGLGEACRTFMDEHPEYDKNVFLMTRFDNSSSYLRDLDHELRTALRSKGFNPVRADDRTIVSDRNLWNNVCVYMICCSKGVAILEDRGVNEFNPNVGIEYGFMRALNKAVLLLADVGFRNLRADVIGTLRETFDLMDIAGTVPPAVERWVRDLGL